MNVDEADEDSVETIEPIAPADSSLPLNDNPGRNKVSDDASLDQAEPSTSVSDYQRCDVVIR